MKKENEKSKKNKKKQDAQSLILKKSSSKDKVKVILVNNKKAESGIEGKSNIEKIVLRPYDTESVARRFKQLRKKMGVSQNEIADALGLSNASISYWENGINLPSSAVIMLLAQYFGVSSDYLLGIDDLNLKVGEKF